jgi:hypothetical protein
MVKGRLLASVGGWELLGQRRGMLGMNDYQTTKRDNFESFDAVLVPNPNSAPLIVTTFDLEAGAIQHISDEQHTVIQA